MKIGTMDLLWLHIFILIYDIAKAAASTETTPVTQTTKDCTSLELPNGDVQFSNSTWIGSVATFTCNDKFYINGSCKQNATSQCLQNKAWSVSAPTCVPKDDGVSFIISKNPFIEGSTDIITMACNTSIPPNNIQYIKIRRKLKNTWETILTLFSDNTLFNSSTSNFVKKISSSVSFNKVATLTLSVNESDLVCEDATIYQCHVVYTNQQCYSEEDNELNGFYFPKAVTLEVSKEGVHLENSSRSYPAQMKLGDTLDLNCTANIGSDPNVTISWLYTTPFSNGQFIRDKPKGNSSPGTATKDDNCQYIRSAIINHTIDTTDEMMGNISYTCEVEVQSPDGSLKTVMSEDVLFVEIYCKSPKLLNGDVHFSNGTSIGSVATFTCNKDYYIAGSCGQNVTSKCLRNRTWSVSPTSCIPKAEDVSLSISDNIFTEGSIDFITIICNSSTTINNIEYMGLRRKIEDKWELIATNDDKNETRINTKSNFIRKSAFTGRFQQDVYLWFSVNESKLTCEDETLYQCYVVYKNTVCNQFGKDEKELKGFFFPKDVSLEGSKNGVLIENTSRSFPAQVKLGDTLDLNCTANIGSNPNVTISWLYTNSFSIGELILDKHTGKSSPGTVIKENCQYIRSATISHTIDQTDVKIGNISYTCQVEVQSPDGSLKTVMSKDVLFVELCTTVSSANLTISSTSTGQTSTTIEPTTVTPGQTSTTIEPTTVTPDCTSLELPNGDVQFSNGTWIGSVATFTCNNNYYINGSCEQHVTTKCLQNGTWSVSTPSCVPKDDGVSLSISKNPFIEDSKDLITITCNYVITTDDFKTMLIRRKLQSTWEVIATLFDDNKTYINSTSNFAKEITYNASIEQGATLSLFVNESDLACEDQTLYQCQVGYDNKYGRCYSEEDKELRGFFFPKAVTLVGINDASQIENSSQLYPAQMKLGDKLDLNCTANIGSDPNATLSLFSANGLFSGGGSLGAAIKGDDCQYMRSDTISHVIDVSDKSIGNITATCLVEVNTPSGYVKKVYSNVVFVEIYDQCPRPSPIKNGNIMITGTSNGSRAELTCDQGYKRSTGFATCTSSGKWDTNMMCSKIDCKNLTIPLNGMVTYNSKTFFNDSAEITCNDGYSLKGQNSSVCQENGQWSNKKNTCVLKRCPPLLSPNNGFITVDNYTSFVNDSVSFSCYPGYKLVGAAVTECSLDYTWSDTTPSCIIQNCTVPSAPSNGFYSLATESSVNTTASLTCKPGYRQFGNGTIQCLVNETWSETSANCTLIECPTPVAPSNGMARLDNGTQNVNDTVSYSCYPGYKIDGANVIECSLNGTWNEKAPFCLIQNCSEPIPPTNGHFVNKTGLSVNSSVDITCNEGHSLTGNNTSIQCLENTTWSRSFAVCNIIGCSSPLDPDNGRVDLNNGKTEVNETVTFSCYPGYKLTGTAKSKCDSNGSWDASPPACVVQNCTNPLPPSNGTYKTSTLHVNSTALLVCNLGYNITGNGTIQCTENGTWTHTSVKCAPIECPELHAPDDGHLKLSNKNWFQSKGSFSCEKGHDLIGSNETECSFFGNWTYPEPLCKAVDCGFWYYTHSSKTDDSPCDISYSPNNTLFGSKAICSCKRGYQINSTRTSIAAECTSNMQWNIVSPPYCSPITCPYFNVSQKPMFVDYSYYEHRVNTKATFACYNNDSIFGHETVTCLTTGQWSGPIPTCKRIETTAPPCPDNEDDRNTVWNETLPGMISTTQCPKDTDGEVSRLCTEKGVWQLPVYDCVRKALVVLDKKIEAIKYNPTEENVDNALDELTSITNSTSSENKGGILSGELEKVTSILETIVDISDKSQVTTKQAESFLETTSNLLDTSNTESWKAISQKKDTSGNNNQPSSGASKILDVVGRYSDALTSLLNNTKNDTKTIKASNLVLHVAKIKENSAVKFSDVSYKSTFNLPSTSLKGLKHVSSVIYRNLSGILSSRSTTDTRNETKHHINSEVVAVKIPNWEKNKKTFKLTLSFAHFQGNKYISPQCSFWREESSTWDVKGCTKNQRSNQSMTFCDCDHLTNFAILMSPWESDNVDTKAIDVISTVGCSISLVALVITIVFHIALWRYVKSDRVVILIHLSLALVISYAIFLGGVDRTENKDACTAVAVLLQYIYLVVFFLMLAEGIEISVSVLYVFTTASRIKWLLPAAWLIPAVIVGISLGATQLKGYGNEQFCWLSVEGGLIYAFVAPAFIIIVVNFVLLVLVLRAAFGARTLAEKSKSERTKAGVKCLCVLLPVMGCTWVIGIFYVNKNMAWIQYVFAVCNSLQGLVIFIFHCALNKQIRMAIERRKRKYASSLLTSASSTKKFSMPRASASSFSDRMDSMSDNFSRDNTSFKSRPGSERKNSISNTYEMISSNSLHSSLMQKKL